jgi:predicted flap endonuclease-1-like 5' DNA nuclease
MVSAALALTSGCDTAGNGAAAGGVFGGALGSAIGIATGHPELGAAIGVAAGMTAGAIIGSINEQQRAQLQAQSPQTLQAIQHNDAVYQQQQQATKAQSQGQTPPPVDAPTPLTVDDIKAMVSAGIKNEAIVAEIGVSKSVYTQADISALQQANPNVDPSVIDCMKKTISS